MNKTLKLLITADIFLFTGLGLIAPILAVYINDSLVGGSLLAAGIASTLYMLTKAVLQVPISKLVDKYDHRRMFVISGYVLIALVPFFYIVMNNIYQLFVIQIMYGVGAAVAFPAWWSLFSTHVEKHHEGYDWSVYSSLVMVETALSASIGAGMAQYLGFKLTFLLVGIFPIISIIILIGLDKEVERIRKVKLAKHHQLRASRNRRGI